MLNLGEIQKKGKLSQTEKTGPFHFKHNTLKLIIFLNSPCFDKGENMF